MTKEEAVKLIKEVLSKADGGCSYCVEAQLSYFGNTFPKFKELAKSANDYFGEHYDLDNWQ